MPNNECDALFERTAQQLRRPAALDPSAKDRLIAALRAEPRPSRAPRLSLAWLARSRPVALSPLVGAAAAVMLVAVGVLIGLDRSAMRPLPSEGLRATAATQRDTARVVHFVLVAPKARRVALVGDFNGWDASATPMRPTRPGGLWSVALPLAPGRHVYAFVVDGSTWMPDPEAPLAPEDGFGKPNSVVVVGGRTAT